MSIFIFILKTIKKFHAQIEIMQKKHRYTFSQFHFNFFN